MEVGTDTLRQNYGVLSTGLQSFTSPFFLCFVILWRNERDAFTSNLADLQMLSAGLQQPTPTGPGHQSNMTDVCFVTVVLHGHSCVTSACCLPGNHPRDHFIPVMESNYALPPHGASDVYAGSVLIGRRGSNDDVGTSDVISSVYSNQPVERFDGFYLMVDVPKLLNSLNAADCHGCARFNVRKDKNYKTFWG